MNDVKCPYCGESQEINHDGGYGYEQDALHEQECISCGKSFVYRTYITFSYTSYQADCLNGEKHKFEPTKTYPKEFTRMRCKDCGYERPLNKEESTIFLKE